ncbi:MAG TPA: NfuA family Fe-S biogenesis protein [Rhodanobacteraceae bacterium]|nr:NfuA family Fe-S biogenesis protein [Rhodanobacteraceae bacterium]
MIQISETAQDHFRRLLQQQGADDSGIRIAVTDPGTPRASCQLQFCEPDDLDGSEWAIECRGFVLYVDGASAEWLDQAQIDYLADRTGGQLSIVAPHIRGEMPAADASVVSRVRYVIDAEINPQLASHKGRVTLVEVDADGVVLLQFGGGCHGCGMVDVTLKQGVEKTLRTRVPEVTAVRDATDHASGSNPYYRGREGRSALGG